LTKRSTPPHHNYTIPFIDAIKQWNIYARPILSVDLPNALVAVFIGINDISDSSKYTFPRNNASDFPSFYKEIIATEFEALETVYEAGYRNFLFMNLPPLERTVPSRLPIHRSHWRNQPGNVKSATPLPNSTMVHTYNSLIASAASNFSSAHPETKSMVFDTYGFLSGILDNPDKYGIKNTTDYCPRYDAPDITTNYAAYGCLPIQEYFWYNTGHITFRVHELLAQAVERLLESESHWKGEQHHKVKNAIKNPIVLNFGIRTKKIFPW
jgi:phospholipase/lecithinase/hemolysin